MQCASLSKSTDIVNYFITYLTLCHTYQIWTDNEKKRQNIHVLMLMIGRHTDRLVNWLFSTMRQTNYVLMFCTIAIKMTNSNIYEHRDYQHR